MSYARLGDRGVEALSNALAVNRIVRGMYLKHCHLTAIGVKHLLQSLLVRINTQGSKELLDSATIDPACEGLKVLEPVSHAKLRTGIQRKRIEYNFFLQNPSGQQSNASRTRQRYKSLASLSPNSQARNRKSNFGRREEPKVEVYFNPCYALVKSCKEKVVTWNRLVHLLYRHPISHRLSLGHWTYLEMQLAIKEPLWLVAFWIAEEAHSNFVN